MVNKFTKMTASNKVAFKNKYMMIFVDLIYHYLVAKMAFQLVKAFFRT